MGDQDEATAIEEAYADPGRLIWVNGKKQMAFIIDRKCLIRISHNITGIWCAYNHTTGTFSDHKRNLKDLLDCIGVSLKRYV